MDPDLNGGFCQFSLLTLVPEAPVFAWLARLDDAPPAPGSVAVLDLSRTRLHGPGLRALVQEMQMRGIRIAGMVGLEPGQLGDRPDQLPPIFPGPGMAVAPPVLLPPVSRPPQAALLVDGNVRSGQRVVHLAGDVSVIGTVSSGAEIVAGGSVHIHGTLRGRATAGQGGGPALIYCQRLEAEMLVVDGTMLSADDMDPRMLRHAVLATSDGKMVVLRTLA